jgi:hypothetical protein
MQAHVHRARDVADTAELRRLCEALFRDVRREDRHTYVDRGRECVNRRDAIHFCTPADDGLLPCYRIFHNAYGPPTTSCGLDKVGAARPMPALFRRVLDDLATRHGVKHLNHVVLHRYLDGDDVINPHHDKFMDIDPASHIACVSLGATRAFGLHHPSRPTETFDVSDGDVVLLDFATNKEYKHGLHRTRRHVGVRYSITARCIDTFYDPLQRLVRTREDAIARAY